MTIYIGIDPGKTGAIAFLDSATSFGKVHDMPWIAKDIDIQQVKGWLKDARQKDYCVACLEYQQAFPRQGAVSAYTLGEGVGQLKGLLLGMEIAFEEVRPAKWKVALSIPVKAPKEQSMMAARRLFPEADLGRKKDQGRSEALLIAEYRRRLENGSIK